MSVGASELEAPMIAGMLPEAAMNALIDHSVKLPASDLFLSSNETHVAVSVRHLGIVRLWTMIPSEMGRRCISYLKVISGMEMVEQRRPLDGRWVRKVDGGGRVDLRIATIPTLYGEDVAIRLLNDGAQSQSVEQLGLPRRDLNTLLAMLGSASGLILVTGPTGSGKTTTLYACLKHLNDGHRKINTIEDPIEYAIPGLRQSQVNPRLEVGFPELLRSVLRQSPDVIMIGEVRDPVTARAAVLAANSGHLVLATLHAPIAAGAVQSMISLGVHPHFLSSCMLGVIAQRLVRSLCPHCKVAFGLVESPQTFDEVRPLLGPAEGHSLYGATGCDKCHRTGYAGRTGVFEILKISTPVRGMIAEGRSTAELRQKSSEEGFLELRRSALLKVARGETSVEEVMRVIPTEYLGIDI